MVFKNKSAMRGWPRCFSFRKSLMIKVEAAAGVVFAWLRLQLWVRRDGLSLNFFRRIDFPNNMLLHWARGVFVEVVLRAIVLSSYRAFDGRRWCKHFLPRAKRKVRLAVARPLGGVVDRQSVRPQERGRAP